MDNIKRRATCPKCKRRLVNLYKRGLRWRCRQCWEKKPWWRVLLRF